MSPSESRPTRWELHRRILGAEVRIRPLFWVSCVLLGVIYYQYPGIGGVGAFFLWLAAVLVSVLIHLLGHAFAARCFGVPVRFLLSGLGGQVHFTDGAKRGRSVLIVLAGPLANGMIFATLWMLTALPLPMAWRVTLAPAIWLLMWVNAFWGLLNLLPLWPLDGGRIAVEIGTLLFGRRGQSLALLASLAVSLALTLFVLLWMRVSLIGRFDARYPVYFAYSFILILYGYALWLSAFRALWSEAPSEPRG